MADRNGALYIDGVWTSGHGDEQITVTNPATEQVIGRVAQGTLKDAQDAITAARRAFDEGPWPRMMPPQRARVLARMGEIMQERYDEIVELNGAEAGSTRTLSHYLQVATPIAFWRDTAERVLPGYQFDAPAMAHVTPGSGIGQGIIAREPFGVASLITPFNFPFMLNAFKVVAALAAGCTAILKPSPYTPLEALLFGEIAEAADLPPGVLNIVTGDAEASIELTKHPMVDIVSFTGSDAVGRQVYNQASAGLKKVVLELGGKSANIVCADADLGRAVEQITAHTFVHAGQGCALLSRTLVHESLHDDLVAALTTALTHVIIGDPADPQVLMGPLIRERERTRIKQMIDDAVEDGAHIAYGGQRPPTLDKGYFLEPTVLTGVSNAMRIAQQEVFGPVNAIIPFSSEDEAIQIANDSAYGLSGSVWSADTAKALGIARRLRTGGVLINGGSGQLSPHVPFGGYKASGLGREFGSWGMDEFLQYKAIEWSAR